jgi:hypothetical protein
MRPLPKIPPAPALDSLPSVDQWRRHGYSAAFVHERNFEPDGGALRMETQRQLLRFGMPQDGGYHADLVAR